MNNKCELYDRDCIDCGECDICDLDSSKTCDDCGRCIEDIEEYRSVTVRDFMQQNITEKQIKKLSDKLNQIEKGQNK